MDIIDNFWCQRQRIFRVKASISTLEKLTAMSNWDKRKLINAQDYEESPMDMIFSTMQTRDCL